MKKILNLFIVGCVLLLVSCNEYSIIEGVNVKGEANSNILTEGTFQTTTSPYGAKGVRFTTYINSDLQFGRIKVTYSNSLNTETKTVYIEKYYSTSISACNQSTESTVDFNFANTSATSVNLTIKCEGTLGGAWNITRTMTIGYCGSTRLVI